MFLPATASAESIRNRDFVGRRFIRLNIYRGRDRDRSAEGAPPKRIFPGAVWQFYIPRATSRKEIRTTPACPLATFQFNLPGGNPIIVSLRRSLHDDGGDEKRGLPPPWTPGRESSGKTKTSSSSRLKSCSVIFLSILFDNDLHLGY